MKRYLCFVLILVLICPCFLVGVSAATTYTFEVMPPTSIYDDYDFTFSADGVAFYSGQVPSGTYNVILHVSEDHELSSLVSDSPVIVDYVSSFENAPTAMFDVSFSGDSFGYAVVGCVLVDFFLTEGFSALFLTLNESEYLLPEGSVVELVSVDDESVHLSEFVTTDMVDSVFFEILAVLPVVVCGVVLLLSTRKGIAFLQSFLHDS